MSNRMLMIGCLTMFICIGLTAFAKVQDKLVEEVELRGYRSVAKEDLLQKIRTKPGERYDADQVKQDYEQVLAMGVFDKLHSKVVINEGPRGGTVVIFDLKELPRQKPKQ
jgi:outer membrane protein assembly factor BamA